MNIKQMEYQENTPMTVEEIIDQLEMNNDLFQLWRSGALLLKLST